jgi:hypothetical protein
MRESKSESRESQRFLTNQSDAIKKDSLSRMTTAGGQPITFIAPPQRNDKPGLWSGKSDKQVRDGSASALQGAVGGRRLESIKRAGLSVLQPAQPT